MQLSMCGFPGRYLFWVRKSTICSEVLSTILTARCRAVSPCSYKKKQHSTFHIPRLFWGGFSLIFHNFSRIFFNNIMHDSSHHAQLLITIESKIHFLMSSYRVTKILSDKMLLLLIIYTQSFTVIYICIHSNQQPFMNLHVNKEPCRTQAHFSSWVANR